MTEIASFHHMILCIRLIVIMQQSDNQCVAKCKKSACIWNEMVLCFEFSSYAKAIVKLVQKNLFLTHLDF
ncbi:hypothetical protein, partial [Prevotella sp. HMSC077E09]|uniref:hypothetical protein n=1 Tax=Prevotella sp. HMSC077E09 TaxID=1739487 RepID=UPI001AEF44CB